MSTPALEIAGRVVGPGQPTYIVAELSANHQQSFERAVELVRAAHAAGANAVKLQTYTADTMTIACDSELFHIGEQSLWAGRTLHGLYREASTPWEWQPRLKAIAEELDLALFSTPFDATAVEFLESMEVPAYKIASFELVDLSLVRKVAATGKPVILSTGMASLGEIEDAVQVARDEGCRELCLLKCTSAYPAPPEEVNLATVPHLARTFNVVAGLSDHTLGIAVPVAAVALGANLVEKHLTLDRSTAGLDSAFSLEPDEFRMMVDSIRIAEAAIGSVHYRRTPREETSLVFRRSLFAVADIRAGERFSPDNVRSIRPGYGLPPKHLDLVLTGRARRDIRFGSPLEWAVIDLS